MTSGVYMITRTDTGERYVGASLYLEERLQGHTYAKFRNVPHSVEVLEVTDSDWVVLNDREVYWYQKLKTELNKVVPFIKRKPISVKVGGLYSDLALLMVKKDSKLTIKQLSKETKLSYPTLHRQRIETVLEADFGVEL